VYTLESSDDARRMQDQETLDHYKRLMSEWKAAEVLAQKREQENAAAEVPSSKLSLAENQSHAAKMAIFRKDSTLSNDVFESLDAPVCATNGDETCRPETVVEESSSVTSPTTELAAESGDRASGSDMECHGVTESLPIKTGLLLCCYVSS